MKLAWAQLLALLPLVDLCIKKNNLNPCFHASFMHRRRKLCTLQLFLDF
jgi:hypothetical protein